MSHQSVPTNIPGTPVMDVQPIKDRIASLLSLNKYRFPGAQPVSFGSNHLGELENEDYFVAEKSDGVRCLALLSVNRYEEPEVYLFDRKNNFHVINARFPLPNDPSFRKYHNGTIIDGEIVIDKEKDGTTTLKFLLFDCLVCNGKVLTSRSLMKRLGYLKDTVIRPHKAMLKHRPELANRQPFLVEFKEQQFSYNLDVVFNEVIPNLKHGNDGLIFTSVNAPYATGTSDKMIKWKPADENSIDFKVRLHFPGSSTIPGAKDYTAKPRIELLIWLGGNQYDYFDELGITDDEWRSTFGTNPRQLDGAIIECNYDPETQQRYQLSSPWRFMRYRNDKPDGNHISTANRVMDSIRDAVKKEELMDAMPNFRKAWKARQHV